MAYFGGGGVSGYLHASLRAYIDCFLSPPFPRLYPREGGVWDQDPGLMRDFRFIRDFEIQWKNKEIQEREMREGDESDLESDGGDFDLENTLNQILEERGLDADDYF